MGKVFTLDGINQDLLLGSRGDDIVQGSADKPGVWNGRRGVIRLRQGDDTIRSRTRIRLYGETSMGAGDDLVTGRESIGLRAVDNFNGSLDLGRGHDRVEVTHGSLVVGEDSWVNTGAGNDVITGAGLSLLGGFLDAGPGDDLIDVGAGRIFASLASALMGDGDDRLVARGGLRLSDAGVDMGAGDDTADVGAGGIDLWDSEWDSIRLGGGNDRLVGFAAIPSAEFPPSSSGGVVRGGRGKDSLVLSEGVYSVTANRVSTAETYLNVAGFNVLEGISGGRFSYAPGVLTVNENGIATFVPEL
ncbi:hypothetical protein [Cyanobium sp. CH-040]|uniref:hypothetical protein n=1 Tax=Cyanobium sp. CH-040 TaxID=2823708 RepID=UPI0020CF4D39|nr:hypothetical protein [Cyanobium sp. CH-040]MCP9928696.1 hypothetical protein [Cyanobium sp. CH-040]